MPPWNPFPHDASAFAYTGNRLREAWEELHRGDRVTFPDERWVRRALEEAPEAAPGDFDGDIAGMAAELREAWRRFHGGDFGAAIRKAERVGMLAHAPANKAAGVYATYLEPDTARQRQYFLGAVERAERAGAILPNDPNCHYFLAFNLGRYSQSISVARALRQGIGGRIQAALTRALEIEPEHAEAHTAFGMCHAEIINKVGKMIGGMTYGASVDQAIEHFEAALDLTPESPIAHIEYGNGLYLMFGERRLEQVAELYGKAVELTPRDAMEKLDIEAALAEME